MLFDELAAAGRPMSLEDFNLYVFCGLRGEFKDLVMSLITKAEPLLYADLHSRLLTHEFLNKNSFHSMDATPSLQSSSLPQQPPLLSTRQPSAHLSMSHYSPNFSRNKGRSRVRWQLCSNFGHTSPYCPQFRSSSQQPSAHLAIGNVSAATWFPDTGVNQHVTPDLATLTDSATYLDNDH